MPCYSPVKGFRGPEGRLVLHARNHDDAMTVPCGYCIGCRIDKSRAWTVRCVHEAQTTQEAGEPCCFITLTYNDTHVPQDGSVDVVHFQKFIRSLRKRTGKKIRFFHCGEYGEKNRRPHYHACLFGIDFADDREVWQTGRYLTYTSEFLAEVWGKGFVTIGELNRETAGYTARYIMKKIVGDLAEDHYKRVDEQTGEIHTIRSEYVTMSRRPGLGLEWIQKYWKDVYPEDRVILNGMRYVPPRYYDEWLKKHQPQVWAEVESKRELAALENAENHLPHRLDARKLCKTAQLSRLRRPLEEIA